MRLLKTDAVTAAVATLAMLLFTAAPILAQTGTVAGVARNAETNAPVNGAHVTIEGVGVSALTGSDGRFSLSNVPVGERTIRVRLIGFAALQQTVSVQAGEITNVELALRPQAVALMEMVVTGSVGATPRAKLPFVVDQVRGTDLQVSAPNFASAIQGKVAGATVVQGSGRPGSAPSVLLRGATSIQATGRDQEPLYIVDGVILGASVVDIDALDVDQIEVIKGAAAASLYGSRAANGVIVITTRRGTQYADGEVRYTIRSTGSTTDLPGEFPLLRSHFWELTPDGNRFIDGSGDRAGLPCDFRGSPGWNPAEQCSANPRFAGQTAAPGATRNEWNTFATNPWPRGTFDHVDRFFDGGISQEHYIAASGRQGATNFLVSFSRSDEQGPMLGQDGFRRNNFRINLDQVVRPDLQVSASAFYSRSRQDDFGEASGNPVFGLTRMMAGVDLASCEPAINRPSCLDDPDNLLLNVNPTNEESANPLYALLVQQNELTRGRFLASTNLRYSPTNWLDFDGDVSWDRLDQERFASLPKGYRTIAPSPSTNEGNLQLSDWRQEALNASITATFRYDLTDRIVNRTQLRYLYEQQDNEFNTTSGHTFAVGEVPRFENINSETLSAGSSMTTVRADGYFIITNFDIHDRYIVDALLRNDGSSLFGADERRHWYGRIAGAWRMSEEPWFNVDAIDEFKLRYSLGTAGGRPSFAAQYETFNVAAGSVTPVNLGNRDLKPEHATEHEFGVDMSLGQRFEIGLTRAITTTDDQIMTVPLPAFTGFTSQVRNVGTLESRTWEATVSARLVTTPTFSWSARVLFDQTESIITSLNVPPFRHGVAGQNMGNVFLIREGEELGTFYGPMLATSCDHLPAGLDCNEFAVDDNGALVWHGGSGLDANLWGTNSGFNSATGQPIMWGTPLSGECVDRVSGERTNFCRIGNTLPDYTLGFSSNLEWRGLSLYGLLEAQQGFDVWNQPHSWALFRRNIAMMDQSNVPEAERKPLGYFDAFYGGLGGLVPNSKFVEDASFVKLRELSLRYRLRADQLETVPLLGGFNSIGLNVTGRNLHTWHSYNGYDPEVGRDGGAVGSAALARVDGFNYPVFRTWSFGVELNF